jgi:hypothetical protein
LTTRFRDSGLNLDTTASGSVTRLTDGSYLLTDSIYVTAIDPIDAVNILECRFRCFRPGGKSPFLSGTIPQATAFGNSANFAGRFTFTAMRSDIGQYLVEVYVLRNSGIESNHLFSSILVTRNNARPQIISLFAPDTLRRPNNGSQNVLLVLAAKDSDGIADIEKVFFRSVNSSSPNFEQPMFDDGDLHVTGDSVANDGRFSRLIPLDSSATLGTKEFRFWARDKSGAMSDSLIHFIVVVPN